jgi:Effector Associated Constant Component 1
VDLTVTLAAEPAGDELRELRHLLNEEDELRGQVQLVERPPREGELGGLIEALSVSLGPGGAGAAVFASVLISWIRHRTGSARVVVRRPDGAETEVTAERVRSMDATQLRSMVQELSQSLGSGESSTGGRGKEGDGEAGPVAG